MSIRFNCEQVLNVMKKKGNWFPELKVGLERVRTPESKDGGDDADDDADENRDRIEYVESAWEEMGNENDVVGPNS